MIKTVNQTNRTRRESNEVYSVLKLFKLCYFNIIFIVIVPCNKNAMYFFISILAYNKYHKGNVTLHKTNHIFQFSKTKYNKENIPFSENSWQTCFQIVAANNKYLVQEMNKSKGCCICICGSRQSNLFFLPRFKIHSFVSHYVTGDCTLFINLGLGYQTRRTLFREWLTNLFSDCGSK